MNNVLTFPSKRKITAEEMENIQKEEFELFLDKCLDVFITTAATELPDVELDLLSNPDSDDLTKMFYFLRESMRASCYGLQGKHHVLQTIAKEKIQFAKEETSNTNEA